MYVWLNTIIYKYPLLFSLVNFTFLSLRLVFNLIIDLSFGVLVFILLYAGSTITLSGIEISHRLYLAEYESKKFGTVQ